MKNLNQSMLVCILICAGLFVSCRKPEHVVNKEAMALNNQGSEVFSKVVLQKYPKDSLSVASALFDAAIKKDAEFRQAYLNLYVCLNSMKKYEESVALCSAWLKNNPDDDTFLYNRGMLYEIGKKSDLANADYKLVADQLAKHPLPAFKKDMSDAEIDGAINRSYILMVVNKNKAAALALLRNLMIVFPDKDKVKNAYADMVRVNRRAKIDRILGNL